MRIRGVPRTGTWIGRGKVGVLVACLVAATACSPIGPPTPPPTSSATSRTPVSSIRVSVPPTLVPGDGSSPSSSPSDGPIVTGTPPNSTAPAGTAAVVTLNGPFGSVDREPSPPDVDWPDAGGLQGLDTYVRSAPLTLTFTDLDLTFAAWTVSVTPAASPVSSSALATVPYPPSKPELLRVTGPSTGDWLLRADVTPTGRAAASYLWRLRVPDRGPPADGHVVVPAPHALLATPDAKVKGIPGSGCYVSTCDDIGRPPPANDLEQLAATPGGRLTLSLGDGSRFVRWNVHARPVDDASATPATLDRGHDPAGVEQASFAAPGSGDWYVTIVLTFDRRRGSYTWYARVTIP